MRVLAVVRHHPWLEAVLIALASAVACAIGLKFSVNIFLRDELSVCWPLIGVQAAVLLRIPRKYWPPVLSGIVLSQVCIEWWEPAGQIIADTVGGVSQVVIVAFALPALDGISNWIKQPRLLRRFIIWPTLLAPALTGLPVAAVLSRQMHTRFWDEWSSWFSGDMLGIVLWLPLGIVMMSRETYTLFNWKSLPRTLSLLGVLVLTAWGIFQFKPAPLAFVIMPLLLLIALKLGFSGSVIAVNLLSVITARETLRHLGPFGAIPDPYGVTTLQLFLAFCMLMCFPISIVLLERDNFEREMKAAYQQMELLAISDGLTGLNNRRRFDAVLAEEWRRAMRDGEPIGLMMIDVDCFKLFNDLYGHLAGDNCLRRIAHCIESMIERAGDVVARFGGEEFVVLMPRTALANLSEIADRIRAEIESLGIEHQGNSFKVVTISIGCWSAIPAPDLRIESLIEAADQGLYLAKQGGRNRVAALDQVESQERAAQGESLPASSCHQGPRNPLQVIQKLDLIPPVQ